MLVKVGCCGFPYSLKRYAQIFHLVEVQKTFYKPPRRETLARWRSTVPKDFEFTVKAWQVVTHPPNSPTWRKAGIKVEEGKESRYGMLRPTEENFEAWRVVEESAETLGAKIIVVQTPPSFGYSEENLRNAYEFFSQVTGRGYLVAWEPRGSWLENLDKVRRIVEELGVIHVTDVLKRLPVVPGEIVYTRLHGLGREINYRYKYTDEDLQKLADTILGLDGVREIYVLFNNVYMGEDAARFREVLRSRGVEMI